MEPQSWAQRGDRAWVDGSSRMTTRYALYKSTLIMIQLYANYRENLRSAVGQWQATELGNEYVEYDLSSAHTQHHWRKRLTTPTTPVNIIILTFFHHCCLLTFLAPLLKAYACPASVSVLSTNKSSRSPRWRMESMFWTMISLLLHQPLSPEKE